MRVSIVALFLVAAGCGAQTRPPILGISHIAVYASDAAKAEHFYVHDVGLKKGDDPEHSGGVRYYVNQEQFVEVLPMPSDAGINRLDHLAYLTKDAEAMRKYLGAKGVTVPETVQKGSDGSAWVDVQDPEGNKVEFVQPPAKDLALKNTAALYSLAGSDPIGRRIIHVGMLVHSQEKENPFYREILGFKPYWHGGMAEDKTDWVSQQVPDGHDWVEYMLTSGPSGSGIPAKMSQQGLGVLNHVSLGVVNMEKAVTTLYQEGRLGDAAPRPQIGRDGKWQFNIYDPDLTRVEVMEFTAAAKPCCSEFTAENPSPEGQP
ncbi:MAG TPA: VOC family protein [Acidobacteriaceae bacterium]|jgi:catechol 2,3-dioxygenase-like lactoylglutathione lyase family enzyme|nr:VOC family protein [Acidobacteriaceae bacterium]